jgi:hypothetical protein
VTAVAVPVRVAKAPSLLWPLARIEAVRYARHPVFLVGLALCAVFSAGRMGPMELDWQVMPAFFIGVLGIVVAARLTRSTDVSAPVISSAPVPTTVRTAALCLACLVPATAGLAMALWHRLWVVVTDPTPEFYYGTYDVLERNVITIVLPVVLSLCGPLLGVAVGRWLRFPGAALLVMVLVIGWGNLTAYINLANPPSGLDRVLHLLTPYTAWAGTDGDGDRPVSVIRSYTGSPTWFAVWALCLGGLAAVAAMWRGAGTTARRTLLRSGAVLVVVAVLALSLAVMGGNDRLFDTTEQGTVPSPAGEYFF